MPTIQLYSMCSQTSRDRKGQDHHTQVTVEWSVRIDEEVAYSLSIQIVGQLLGKANPQQSKIFSDETLIIRTYLIPNVKLSVYISQSRFLLICQQCNH